MKRENKALSLVLSGILLAGSLFNVNVSAATTPYFVSDTSSNLTLANGVAHDSTSTVTPEGTWGNTTIQSYIFKVTTYGTNATPQVVSGNRNLLSIKLNQKINNSYYYKLTATDKDIGGSVGIYANLPGQKSKCLFVVNVETFRQLYPEPKLGTIRTSMPHFDFWLWDYIDYVQVYSNSYGGWYGGYIYTDFQQTGEIKKYKDQFDKYYPNVENTPFPTREGQDGERVGVARLYVYTGGGQYPTEYR